MDHNKTIALSSVFIALCSFFVSVWVAVYTARYLKLSVKQNLDLSFLDSKEFELVGIELHSTGLGPAVIKKIDIYFDNRLVSDFNEINEHPSTSQIWKNNKPIGRLPNFGSEVYMPVGMRVPIYTVKSSEINDWDSFQNLIHERIYLRAEVCSVYNDCTSTCLDYDSQC